MDTGSHIIQLKAFVCIRFGNDTLPALQPHVHHSEHLLSMVDIHRLKNATPLTFDWQGITYPKEWDIKYKERCTWDKLLANPLYKQPISFYSFTNFFKFPKGHPTPRFTPMTRSSSISTSSTPHTSSLITRELVQKPINSFSTKHSQVLHRGHHKDCPACKNITKKMQQVQKGKGVNLCMFSQLPKSNSAHEEVSSTRARSFILGRNLPDAPFKQFSKDGQIKREYLNHRSSAINDIVSDETELLNYSSLQQ